MRQLVVLAGGLGSRLSQYGIEIPKILLEINGRTLIEYVIEEAIASEYDQILLVLGHKSESVKSFIEARHWGIDIRIEVEANRIGTGGALLQVRDKLNSAFTVVLGDLLVRECNLGGTFNFFLRGGFDALLLVKYTDHPKDSDLVSLNAVGKVEGLLTYPHKVIPDIPIATSGIMHCRLDFIPDIAPSKPFDLFKDLIPTRLESKIYAVFHQGIIRDVGTIDRLKVAGKLVKHVTKYDKSKVALILDRDGTLIEDIPYNCNPVELKLFQHSYFLASGLDGLCDFVAVITNQPLIARGLGTLMQVEKFNGALVDALGSKSAIDAFFVCPHHPDLGFQGEVPELKTPCNCRKPEVFSFIRAANRGEFYLTNSIVVGDSEKDIHSAMRIGAKWLHIHNGTMFSSLNCEYNFNFNGSCATPGNMKDRIMELYDSI